MLDWLKKFRGGHDGAFDFETFLAAARESGEDLLNVHRASIGLGKERRWMMDQDTGSVTFVFAEGRRATAEPQIIGTFDRETGTLLWAWDHPSIAAPLAEQAKALQAFGEAQGIARLTARKIECTEDEAFAYTCAAARLAERGVPYRVATADKRLLLFLTLDHWTLEADESARPTDRKKAEAEGVTWTVEPFEEAGEPVEAPEIHAFVRGYLAEMCEIDREYHAAEQGGREGDHLGAAIAKKIEVFERTWRVTSDYWEPCSCRWPSDEDINEMAALRTRQLAPDRWLFVYVKKSTGVSGLSYALDVIRFDDGLRIVDLLFEGEPGPDPRTSPAA